MALCSQVGGGQVIGTCTFLVFRMLLCSPHPSLLATEGVSSDHLDSSAGEVAGLVLGCSNEGTEGV